MNIAIIIGVSKYSDTKNNLPGCKNDAEAIYKILQKTEKFTPILYINEEETSAKTKELVRNFIAEHKGKQIEELFFYYSGHGEFTNDEFYYILSDFDSKKKNQTSLSNNEIDDLIRTLSPILVVKVLDACQSGSTYIKESNVVSKYFNETKKGFNKCYFLNSSLNNQSSYQDKTISYFTFSFVNALKEHKTDEICYKDIIDVISDEFATNQEQTPFFVVQADYTEKFCLLTKGLREFLSSFDKIKLNITESKTQPITISQLVKNEAKEYIDKEGTIQVLEFIRKEYSSFKFDNEISDLYKIDVEFLEDYQNVPKRKVIENWLDQNPKEYFATIIFGEGYDEFGQEYFTKEFALKIDVPFKVISINFQNNFPNIPSYNAQIIFFTSRKSLRFFFFITDYFEESWDHKVLNTAEIQWITNEVKITDRLAVVEQLQKINKDFEKRIKKDLEAKFNISNSIETTTNDSNPQIPDPNLHSTASER